MSKQTTKIDYNGEKCSLTVNLSPARDKKHTWLFVTVPHSPEDINYNGITRRPPYDGYVKGDATDKEWKRYNKAEVALQKEAIALAVANGLIDRSYVENLKFSKRGYCSCGCSPGWTTRDYQCRSIWITIRSPKKDAEMEQCRKDYAAKRELERMDSANI